MEVLDKYNCRNYSQCGNEITFTEKDNEYYIQRGWVHANGSPVKPKECKPCRIKRKKAK